MRRLARIGILTLVLLAGLLGLTYATEAAGNVRTGPLPPQYNEYYPGYQLIASGQITAGGYAWPLPKWQRFLSDDGRVCLDYLTSGTAATAVMLPLSMCGR